jgi:hypothetical protein
MEKLTGKCKEDFYKWYFSKEVLESNKLLSMYRFSGEKVVKINFLAMPESCQNALFIDFFDSKNYKGLPLFEYCFSIFWKIKPDWLSFHNVTKQSIEKANELYNDTK